MTRIITEPLYLDYSANDNTLAMLEIWEAPYFVPLKGGKSWQGFKRVDLGL